MKKLFSLLSLSFFIFIGVLLFKPSLAYSQTNCNDQDRINCIQTSGNFWASQLCACFYTGMSCSIGNAQCNTGNTSSCINTFYDGCTSYQTGSGSGYAEENRCCYNAPTPTPTPTITPCVVYSTASQPGYANTCAGDNGIFTDNCGSNQMNAYSCNASNLCQLFTAPCSAGETCVKELNGLTHCVAVPAPAPKVSPLTALIVS